jgi:hypothetical protein
MTKTCSKCNTEKDVSEFNKQKYGDGYKCWCRACCNSYLREYQEQNKDHIKLQRHNYHKRNKHIVNAVRRKLHDKFTEKIWLYYEGTCYICNLQTGWVETFHCHHLDPNTKDNLVKQMRFKDWETEVVPEMEKCIYVCANCHAHLHKGRYDEDIASGKLVLIPGKEGARRFRNAS